MRTEARQPAVSVVMPTYRRRDMLPRVLAPLLGDPAVAEVLVVIDGARDGSLEYLQAVAADHPRLRPLFVSNRGAVGARDAGAEAATSEVLLFLDDDVVASTGLAAGHARHHETGAGRVVIGWMPVAASTRPAGYPVELYSDWYDEQIADYERNPDAILLNLWAGNVSLRRSDWARVRFSSTEFSMSYNADRDFGLRCLRAGLTGVFDRSLRAEHLYERTSEQFLRDARSSGEGQWLIHQRHRDIVGPLPDDAFERGLPPAARRPIRLVRRPRLGAATDRAGRIGLEIAGRIGARRWERRLGILLTRVHQQRAATLAARRARRAHDR
jgi:glycosyltransferase involved in cell wall biosynthesis